MNITLDQASRITRLRNDAMVACDVDAFLALWADDCLVEGPQHYLEGKDALAKSIRDGLAAMKPVQMLTRSLAVNGPALFYEFSIVWEVRESGDRFLFTGMSYHEVDDDGKLSVCREYFDPPGHPRRSAAESPETAAVLGTAPQA